MLEKRAIPYYFRTFPLGQDRLFSKQIVGLRHQMGELLRSKLTKDAKLKRLVGTGQFHHALRLPASLLEPHGPTELKPTLVCDHEAVI